MIMKKKSFNIIMYSHDTYGLGHIRRTMAIASRLRDPETNILIITGSPIAGRYPFPEQVDFVRIPGMIKKTNEEYLPMSIKINTRHALDIRKNIITATVKTFQPHLLIVDKEPLGLNNEILPALKWLQKCCPGVHTVLGLRDIMDDANTIRKTWKKKGIYQSLDKYYSEIWAYGLQEFYDPIKEYDIPEHISRKIRFTGYLPRQVKSMKDATQERKRHRIRKEDKLVVVTIGGGGDGYPVMDAYLSMLERRESAISYKSILITGPFMPKAQRKDIFNRSRMLNVKVIRFYRHIEKIFTTADLVISMGGYNTLCELMSQKKVSLLIPRKTPRLEQTLRAQCFYQRNLLDFIPWEKLSPELLQDKVDHLLQNPEVYQDAMSTFIMTGFDVMRQRIREFRNQN
jgi:predicted glycosyltransferase